MFHITGEKSGKPPRRHMQWKTRTEWFALVGGYESLRDENADLLTTIAIREA